MTTSGKAARELRGLDPRHRIQRRHLNEDAGIRQPAHTRRQLAFSASESAIQLRRQRVGEPG